MVIVYGEPFTGFFLMYKAAPHLKKGGGGGLVSFNLTEKSERSSVAEWETIWKLIIGSTASSALFLFDHWRLSAAYASLGASACEHGGGAATARSAASTSQWRRLERGQGRRGRREEEEKEEEEEQEQLCRWETFWMFNRITKEN